MENMHMELAALAVFKSLYDNDKNVYNIIWEFTKNSLAKRELREFEVSDLNSYFAEDYGFNNIPVAVFTTMLRKHKKEDIEQLNNKYYIMPRLKRELSESDAINKIEEQKAQFAPLMIELSEYIESKTQEKCSNDKITTELRAFLLDECTVGKYTDEINEFILAKQDQQEFLCTLNQIKEGFILYSGICWCEELNELGTWKNPLTLYFDMDIIFYLAGYSGEIYQTLIKELYELVQEINVVATRKSGSRIISIKYFSEERERIDHYFDIAESIVRLEKDLDPSETAMFYIVNHCETPSDVISMKANLYSLLQSMAIFEDDKSMYDNPNNWSNNIESKELIEKYGVDRESKKKVERYLKRINYISLLREGHESTNFQNCSYIMVTRNHLAAQLDGDADTLIVKKQCRRVISPEVLTSRFWFQMNKGFSRGHTLMSIDVVAQAKIIMTSQINKNISELHHNIKRSFAEGEITQDQAVRQCAELRKYCVTPDGVTREILAETCALSECSVEEMISKQEEERNNHLETLKRVENLEKRHVELEQSVKIEHERAEAESAIALENAQRIEEQKGIIQKKEEKIQTHEQDLQEKDKQIEDLQKRLREHDECEVKRKARNKVIIKWILFVTGMVVFVIGCYRESKLVTVIGGVGPIVDMVDGLFSIAARFRHK